MCIGETYRYEDGLAAKMLPVFQKGALCRSRRCYDSIHESSYIACSLAALNLLCAVNDTRYMDTSKLLEGLKIIKTVGEYSHVSLARPAFLFMVNRKTNTLSFSQTSNKTGQPVRVYDISGVKLFQCVEKGDFLAGVKDKTSFVMKTEDAVAAGAIGVAALEFDSALITDDRVAA